MNKQERVDFLLKKTSELYTKGIDCMVPKSEESKRYMCLDCRLLGKNEFCKALTQLELEDL